LMSMFVALLETNLMSIFVALKKDVHVCRSKKGCPCSSLYVQNNEKDVYAHCSFLYTKIDKNVVVVVPLLCIPTKNVHVHRNI
jgi:hypothetical protein